MNHAASLPIGGRGAGRGPGTALRFLARLSGWLLVVVLGAGPAGADPDYGDFVLPGFDPVLHATANPHWLGVSRQLVRNRLLAQGLDPVLADTLPSLESLMRHRMEEKIGIDLRKQVTLREDNPFSGLASVFQYPDYFFLFQAAETLPGGFVYYPPRPVGAEEVVLYVDDLDQANQRRWAVDRVETFQAELDLRTSKQGREAREGVNLTIPIKLPRSLEKIIGKGEKTNIRITGREQISIAGESTVSNKFTPTERVRSQSLFPTLDMQQQLQINLAGTIGEKINVEVDHNSQAIGPDATKIRLMYKGNEDEIIKTIETGDVGLTLPGSQLLGYSSNKSGLFGIKVTGQVGRADFTVVASKQKAESAAKSFNSRGGEVRDHVVEAYQYLNNRFFRLDLPSAYAGSLYPRQISVNNSSGEPVIVEVADAPSRNPQNEFIDPSSVLVFQFVGGGLPQADDVTYVAAYVDSTGRWQFHAPVPPANDTGPAVGDEAAAIGDRWRTVPFDLLLDQNNQVVALDLRREFDERDQLAVIYNVVGNLNDPTGTFLYAVGDRPGVDDQPGRDRRIDVNGDGKLYYRMKLLKPQGREPHTWYYVLRNIYSLGGSNIDFDSFDLRIEINQQALDHPELDASTLPWTRIFGLDRTDPQRTGPPDGLVDKNDPLLFDLQAGLLKFPLDFPEPFNGTQAVYAANADTAAFVWNESLLKDNRISQIYDININPVNYSQFSRFRIVASHASAASSFNLGASNIEEGSETVTLDGQTLQRGTDYEIDYTFGQITLKGEAAGRLSADSQVGVNYQYAPFLGGGKSSLLGLNLGYDIGQSSRLSTTWLFQSNQIAGHKAKLGEEPSHTLVGNVSVQHTFKPYFLTHVANFLSRHDSERESSLQFNGEAAISLPNPNTRGKVYLEDFEGIDASDQLTISRIAWSQASTPAQGDDPAYVAATNNATQYEATGRVPTLRWFLPRDAVLRRYLNPELKEQERRESQQVLNVYLRPGPDGWQANSWGGIMRGLGRVGLDLSKSQFLEFWVNDFELQGHRRGTLHIDFGYLSEDFYWPRQNGLPVTGTFQQEDNGDGVFTYEEDTGLDGNPDGTDPDGEGDDYRADTGTYEDPFPFINGTEGNNREDTEDLDGDTVFDQKNGYFTVSVDLADSALVDVVRDYSASDDPQVLQDVQELQERSICWRKYRIRLGDMLTVSPPGGTSPDISIVTHVRIWYEDHDPDPTADPVQLQFSEINFLGSRWEREGIRKWPSEALLPVAERGGAEFFLGEVNNKENPGYSPPLPPHEENRIPEKETSLVLDYQHLERNQMTRISKLVSPQGDDYTLYTSMSWWWFNPAHQQADLDLFFRVGADTANYYEVRYRFADSPRARVGWKQMHVDLAELSNVKTNRPDSTGVITGTLYDVVDDEYYRVRVVGRPDLRRVKRYYFGVINDVHDQASGTFYLDDVLLDGIKRDVGLASRIAVGLNMADVIKVDFDWSRQDADFHGLNASVGQGFTKEDWGLTTSFRVDDFLPMLGFQLPVNLSRRQTINRPKYITNSDIELIDINERNRQSTIDERNSYSVRLNHAPSRAAIPRYIIDPWSVSLSSSRSRSNGPLQSNHQSNVQGSVTYNLRIAGDYALGRYPLLGSVPLVKQLKFLPSKFTMSANYNKAESYRQTIDLDGNITPQPTNRTERGTVSGQFEYTPLPIVNLSVNARSERDLLRREEFLGLNVGRENGFAQDMRLTFTMPRASTLPQFWLFSPLRIGLKAANQLNPNITFNGSFSQSSDPNLRQPGDPPGVKGVSNSGDWDLRLRVPVGDFFKHTFPEKGMSAQQRQQALQRESRLERRGRAQGRPRPSTPPGPGTTEPPGQEQPTTPPAEGQEGGGEPEAQAPPPEAAPVPAPEQALTPDEQRRRDEEALLEAARQREQEEREAGRPAGGPGQAAGQAGQPEEAEQKSEGFKFPNPLNPVLGVMRSVNPVQVSYSKSRNSRYNRLAGETSFWYRAGLLSALDVPDSVYTGNDFQERQSLSLATDFRVTSKMSCDLKFNKTDSSNRGTAGLATKSYQQDWPDVRVSVSGLEKLPIFGGGGDGEGWFRSSNLDLSYKQSRTVNNYTATYFNPQTTTNISPKWNVTLRNGMTASLNVTLSNSGNKTNGALTESDRTSVDLQVRHSFPAERLLAKLHLYKPGSSPTLNMNFDVSYARNTQQRTRPGSEYPDAPTGTTRLSVNPRFTYQINRNLSGTLRFIFSRDKTLESDLVRKSFGLGVEATFVF